MRIDAPVACGPAPTVLLARPRRTLFLLIAWSLPCWTWSLCATTSLAREESLSASTHAFLEQYCFDCHGSADAEAHLNLAALAESPRLATEFRRWEHVITMLNSGQMPPEDLPSPSRRERQRVIDDLKSQLDRFATDHAGDPGRVMLRRLTTAEYAYTIHDLTGLNVPVRELLAEDAVGGEGFANVGDVQFMQDSTMERYLAAAKWIANRAVIGAGPLKFFPDAGQTGRELSAIDRIQRLYRRYGFRTAAGEGGEPFGLDLYPRGLFALWRLHHRHSLKDPQLTLSQAAQEEDLEPRFLQHLQSVIQQSTPSFPTSEIVDLWRKLPAPDVADRETVRQACDLIGRTLRDWQRRLARAAGDDEEAAVLSRETLTLPETYDFRANLSWPENATEGVLELDTQVLRSSEDSNPVIRWEDAKIRFSFHDEERSRTAPLADWLQPTGEATATRLVHRAGNMRLRYRLPPNARRASVRLRAELELPHGQWALVRCSVRDGGEQGDTAADTGEVSAVIGNATGRERERWFRSVLDFAEALPDCSHREAAPSDRDPIPSPFDNTYNTAERNAFHTFVKYHRDDGFLYAHMLPDAARDALDEAWTDLLTSFDYHQVYLDFIARQAGARDLLIDRLDSSSLTSLPPVLRRDAERLAHSYRETLERQQQAQPRHLVDTFHFAAQAWRRSVTKSEQSHLKRFYEDLRDQEELPHDAAIRTVLTRILVSPPLLYRLEPHAAPSSSEVTMTTLQPLELANRISYFLTASPPDAKLIAAAQAGKLSSEDELTQQTHRLLSGPKVSRFVSEFFGQWFGVYRFADYQGIDPERFPEFDEDLRADLEAEVQHTFAYIVRNNRPLSEILFADYSFLNRRLAAYYQLPSELCSQLPDDWTRVEDLAAHHRGGLLQFGAIHALTSAPLRTSAVKRGDWILRRVLGTPVPPPPADAGSLPTDEVSPSGLTARAQLLAHRDQPACIQCHQRMDPLGFALENFDPIGRYRVQYQDGQPVDASGELPSGRKLRGSQDLLDYLKQRQPDFYRTLSAKLLGYALGRRQLLSDRQLMRRLQTQAAAGQGIHELATSIVTSPQFRTRRPSHPASLDR